MKWTVDFYNERRRIVARYDVHAPSAATAVVLGRQVMLVQYPPASARGRLSLFERAQRIGGQDETGSIVYRIAKGDAIPHTPVHRELGRRLTHKVIQPTPARGGGL